VTSERDNLERPIFNTRPNVVTRSVRISGYELVWDGVRDNEYGLMRFSGNSVLDMESLEKYADRVVIAAPLRFPGSSVSVHARELEFVGNGSINTTPIGFGATAARARYHLDDGVTPADRNGNATYAPADGLDGQSDGDIGIFVNTLKLPTGGEKVQRFVSRGSAGQAAEPGGKRPYAPRDPATQPTAQAGKARAGTTAQVIKNKISDIMPIAKNESNWIWPDGASGPGSIRWNGVQLFPDSDGHVVDLELIPHDDQPFSTDTNWLCFPSGARDHFLGHKSFRAPSWKAVIPGNGEDAYAGGKPGNGGAGGTIRTALPLEMVASLCDTAGGAPGAPTATVTGGEAGGPRPASRSSSRSSRRGRDLALDPGCWCGTCQHNLARRRRLVPAHPVRRRRHAFTLSRGWYRRSSRLR
jgi:hypothetical protein